MQCLFGVREEPKKPSRSRWRHLQSVRGTKTYAVLCNKVPCEIREVVRRLWVDPTANVTDVPVHLVTSVESRDEVFHHDVIKEATEASKLSSLRDAVSRSQRALGCPTSARRCTFRYERSARRLVHEVQRECRG